MTGEGEGEGDEKPTTIDVGKANGNGDAAPPRPPSPGRCRNCGDLVPRSAILPSEGSNRPGRHMVPGERGKGVLCGPVLTMWAYHFSFHWQIAGKPIGGFSDAPIQTDTPIDSPEMVERARNVLATQVEPRDVGGERLFAPASAIHVTIISFQMIAMR